METARTEGGQAFYGSAGRWAGERLIDAMKSGKEIGPSALRTLDTLRKDEWKAFDEALVEGGKIRLRGVADLNGAGLTMPVANAMGKTLLEWEKVTDMNPAGVSLSGVSRTEDDRILFSLDSIPLPIVHKDFNLNLRTLAASRNRGQSLDTMQATIAGRLVAEKIEEMLFSGLTEQFAGKAVYGYTTHPNRNVVDFGDDLPWNNSSKTGQTILDDVILLMEAAKADRFYGPYWLYIPSLWSAALEQDFKAASDKTVRTRLLEVDLLDRITVADSLPTDEAVLIQPTRDVVTMVNGEPLQTVQWDIEGGFIINFKAFTIQVPLIRADSEGRSGVQHLKQVT